MHNSDYAQTDPQKFSSTPAQVSRVLKEVWNKCEPTSERIIRDFRDFRRIYNVIYDNDGIFVRSGATLPDWATLQASGWEGGIRLSSLSEVTARRRL